MNNPNDIRNSTMQRGKVNLYRVLLITILISLGLSYAILSIQMLGNKYRYTHADFIIFYTAGRIAQLHGPQNVYELGLQQQIEQTVFGYPIGIIDIYPYNHLPILIPILQLLIREDYVTSFVIWQIFLVLVYGLSAWILIKPVSKLLGIKPFLPFIEIMVFLPVYASIATGQDTAILFFGSVLLLIGFLSEKDELAGFGLAMTSVRPQITLILMIPFFINRRKVFWWFLAGVTVLGLLSLSISGTRGILDFIHILLISSKGSGYDAAEYDMVNMIGVLTRATPWLGAQMIRIIGWVAYLFTMIFFVIWGLKSHRLSIEQIATSFVLALFMVPHLHYHDLALLLIPIFSLMLILNENRFMNSGAISLLPLIFSIALLLSNITRAMKFNFPAFIMAILLIWLLFPGTIHSRLIKIQKAIIRV